MISHMERSGRFLAALQLIKTNEAVALIYHALGNINQMTFGTMLAQEFAEQ